MALIVSLVASAQAHHPAKRLRAKQIHAAHMESLSRDSHRWDRARHWRAGRVRIKRRRVRLAREHRACQTMLTRPQRSVARSALREARRRGARPRAQVALIAAGIVESNLRNLSWGHADSEGFLQVRVSIHGRRVARSVKLSSRKFLTRGFWNYGGAIRLARTGLPAGVVAQRVQGSAYPARYGRVTPKARRIVRCYGGGR